MKGLIHWKREIKDLKKDVAQLKISRATDDKSTCTVAILPKKKTRKEVQASTYTLMCRSCGKMGHKSEYCCSLSKTKEKFKKFKENFWNVKCYVCGENHLAKDCQKRFEREDEKHEKEDKKKAFYV